MIQKVGLDMDEQIFTISDLVSGMNVELEHGNISPFTNVSNDDIVITGKIALAHLNEFPDYYQRLKKMEADGSWKNKPKKVRKRRYFLCKTNYRNWWN